MAPCKTSSPQVRGICPHACRASGGLACGAGDCLKIRPIADVSGLVKKAPAVVLPFPAVADSVLAPRRCPAGSLGFYLGGENVEAGVAGVGVGLDQGQFDFR